MEQFKTGQWIKMKNRAFEPTDYHWFDENRKVLLEDRGRYILEGQEVDPAGQLIWYRGRNLELADCQFGLHQMVKLRKDLKIEEIQNMECADNLFNILGPLLRVPAVEVVELRRDTVKIRSGCLTIDTYIPSAALQACEEDTEIEYASLCKILKVEGFELTGKETEVDLLW